jgi:hypothetical protein
VSRVPVTFQDKQAWIVLDQIRTVEKRHLIKRIGKINASTIARVKMLLSEMLVEYGHTKSIRSDITALNSISGVISFSNAGIHGS